MQSRLIVKDNSGVKKGQCIKIYQGTFAKLGDIILISIKIMKPGLKKKTKLKKGDIVKSLLIHTKYAHLTHIGYISFDKNQIILIDNKYQPLGNRILGPITNELRKKKFNKIISIASYVV